jgi:hypothetical protein
MSAGSAGLPTSMAKMDELKRRKTHLSIADLYKEKNCYAINSWVRY